MSPSVRGLGIALLATSLAATTSRAQGNASLDCDWVIRASSPIGVTESGDNATFMLMGPTTMIMLTGDRGTGGGSITIQGLGGPGTYPVGATGPSGSGAILTLQDQNGAPIALSSGDGSPFKHQGAVIGTLPPPAQLAIQAIDNSHMRADLTGTFFRMDATTLVPPRLVLVPVHITLTAAPVVPSLRARPCS